MAESWRTFLYPLGFLASVVFFARMVLQWVASERLKSSTTPRLFWTLSLLGNLIMVCHTLIQIQYPLCLIQSANAVIVWRHLSSKTSVKKVWILLITTLLSITLLFLLQGFWMRSVEWIRTPILPWHPETQSVSLFWPLIGFTGTTLFGARFFFQWWQLEKHKKSDLSALFWWSSLFGATVALIYFVRIGDWVNILGYGSGLLPYTRNLILLRRHVPTS